MNFHFKIILLLPIVWIAGSCTTLKRYESIEPSAIDNSLADISLFGIRLSEAKPPEGNKTLWDLSADAQSQYIKILNNRYPDNDKFIEAMSYKYLLNSQDEGYEENYINKDMRLIFSVSRLRDYGKRYLRSGLDLSPADRLEYLKINLNLEDDSHLRFTGWNMFTTEYGSIDIADISFSRSLDVEASAMFPGNRQTAAPELTGAAGSTMSRREDQQLKYRYLKLNGRINSSSLEIEEEGVREIDLTGNILADISLCFDRFPLVLTSVTGITDSTGRLNDPSKLAITFTDVSVPAMEELHDTLFASLSLDYVFRNVVKGRKTFQEWDDRVKYYTGTVSKKVPLFTLADYLPPFCCLGIFEGDSITDIIRITTGGGPDNSLVFRTCQEASAFKDWLGWQYFSDGFIDDTVRIGSYILSFGDNIHHNQQGNKRLHLRVVPYFNNHEKW